MELDDVVELHSVGGANAQAVVASHSRFSLIQHPKPLTGEVSRMRRPSHAGKWKIIKWLLADEEWSAWSDREIARRCLVRHDMVGWLRTELSGGNRQIPPAARPLEPDR